MRTKFWSEPLKVKFARFGASCGGFSLTGWGVQVIIAHIRSSGHDTIGLLPAFAALSTGVALLQGGLMGDSGWITRLRNRVEHKELSGPNQMLSEEQQIEAIKRALTTD
jgi:hypothetical protein